MERWRRGRVVGIKAHKPGCDCGKVSAALATRLAASDKKILVVALHPAPELANHLGAKFRRNARGLSDWLQTSKDLSSYILATRYSQISFLPSGSELRWADEARSPTSPKYGSLAWVAGITLVGDFDYVIVDVPSDLREPGGSLAFHLVEELFVLCDQAVKDEVVSEEVNFSPDATDIHSTLRLVRSVKINTDECLPGRKSMRIARDIEEMVYSSFMKGKPSV